MKTRMTEKMWQELEPVLAKLNAGYKVEFDNHHGIPEMLVYVDTIGIMRLDMDTDDLDNETANETAE